jgi:hypothetical protein
VGEKKPDKGWVSEKSAMVMLSMRASNNLE